MAKRFLAIGECMIELAATGDGMYRQGFAGDTFNTSWHARRDLGPGWRVGYFTALGDDAWSTRIAEFMKAQNIETTYVQRLAGQVPGVYLIDLKDGERSFAYWRSTSAARELADDADALEAATVEANAIYFSGITLGILAPDARGQLLAALGRAKARGATVAFDSNLRPALWPERGAMRAAIRAAARVSTIAFPTMPDEAVLFGEAGASEVADRYIADGCPEVVVRAGPDPALVVFPGGRETVAAVAKVKPVDTTGAGDSFNGAYLAARLQGKTPVEAAEAAHSTAARVIGAYGALA